MTKEEKEELERPWTPKDLAAAKAKLEEWRKEFRGYERTPLIYETRSTPPVQKDTARK